MSEHIGKTYTQVGGCFGLLHIVLMEKYGKGLLDLQTQDVAEVQDGDILEIGGTPGHCGVAVGANQVLHADLERGVVIDALRGPWTSANKIRILTNEQR